MAIEHLINLPDDTQTINDITGPKQRFLKLITDKFKGKASLTKNTLVFTDTNIENFEKSKKVIEKLLGLYQTENRALTEGDVHLVIKEVAEATVTEQMKTNKKEIILVHGPNGKVIKATNSSQLALVHSVDKNDITFAIGPAGSGKTYTAVALAVRALKEKHVQKIILTRPAVEAGESLGFLPGDLKEKIDPYLRPLYDALDDMIPSDKLNYYMANRIIEIAPLAFMRGRTLDNAFVILDEAQNTNDLQMKMFLTRLGPHAKAVITGDMSQIDLPKNQKSGLNKAATTLKNIKGIGVIETNAGDIVRHRLVKDIVAAYDKADVTTTQPNPA